jgi:hypothetical protein
VFNSNARWGDATEFLFSAADGSQTAVCGDSLPSHEGVKLSVRLPSKATIRLIGNGELIAESHSDSLDFPVSAQGLYRVEAWKGKRGWIFSNHIRVGID